MISKRSLQLEQTKNKLQRKTTVNDDENIRDGETEEASGIGG